MSIINLFTTQKSKLKISSFEADISESESHEREAVVTVNPVEEGVDISDHIQIRPAVLSVTGLVTATPVRFLGFLTSEQRVNDAWDELKQLQASRTTMEIQTGLDLYENMVMTSLKAPRDSRTGQALRFTATFQEIVFANTELVSVAPSPTADAQELSSEPQSLGKQPTSDSGLDPSLLSEWTGLRG